MNESDAKAHFRAMGIPRPSQCLIDAWIRAHELERQSTDADRPAAKETETTVADPPTLQANPVPQSEPVTASRPGKSLLEPILRERGSLAEPPKRRKPGRPRIVASWFPAIAKTMADGTTLRVALAINGLSLSAREMRALYRNRTFQALYQEARRRYLIENWGRSKAPSLGALLGRCL